MCTFSSDSSSPPSRHRLYAALEGEHGSAYVLRPDLSLEYVNGAWRQFARENGAPQLATDWDTLGAIPQFFVSPLRELFTAKLRRVLASNDVWTHSYECSSDQVYRHFTMRAQPTAEGDGLIVVHSLVAEAPLARSGCFGDDAALRYTDERGLIVQCSSCARVRNPARGSWDWARGHVSADLANVSHGICPTCDFQYYG